MYCFDLVTANLKVENFVRTDSALLDEAMAANNDEELPFGIVPVLALCYTRLADVDAYLAAVQGMYELCK